MSNKELSGRLDLNKLDLLYFNDETHSTMPIRWEELDSSQSYRLSVRKRGVSLIYPILTLDEIKERLNETNSKIGLEGASICIIPQTEKSKWH